MFGAVLTPVAATTGCAGARVDVTAAQGEAIINLSVTVSEGCALLNSFPVLNVLPIWPGCVPITIEGEIVRSRQKPTTTAQR